MGSTSKCVTIWNGATGDTLWEAQLVNVGLIQVLPDNMFLVHVRAGLVGELVFFDSSTYTHLHSITISDQHDVKVLQPGQSEDGIVRIVSSASDQAEFALSSYSRNSGPVLPKTTSLKNPIVLSSVLPNNKFVIVTKSDLRTYQIYAFQCVANEVFQLSRHEVMRNIYLTFSIPTPDGGVLLGGHCSVCSGVFLAFPIAIPHTALPVTVALRTRCRPFAIPSVLIMLVGLVSNDIYPLPLTCHHDSFLK